MDCSNWSDHRYVRLVLKKLGPEICKLHITKKTSDLMFKETVTLLYEVFSQKTLLFHERWKYMNLVKKEDKDFISFASIVNNQCEVFKLAKLNPDNFKLPVFVQGLMSTKDAEIRRKVLNKLENEPNLSRRLSEVYKSA